MRCVVLQGFVLSCSTFPVGPGVKLELSVNAEMWTVSRPFPVVTYSSVMLHVFWGDAGA